jgi:hypothetical protein
VASDEGSPEAKDMKAVSCERFFSRYRAETASIGITDLPAAGLELKFVN